VPSLLLPLFVVLHIRVHVGFILQLIHGLNHGHCGGDPVVRGDGGQAVLRVPELRVRGVKCSRQHQGLILDSKAFWACRAWSTCSSHSHEGLPREGDEEQRTQQEALQAEQKVLEGTTEERGLGLGLGGAVAKKSQGKPHPYDAPAHHHYPQALLL
jgi:hypothetical protein